MPHHQAFEFLKLSWYSSNPLGNHSKITYLFQAQGRDFLLLFHWCLKICWFSNEGTIRTIVHFWHLHWVERSRQAQGGNAGGILKRFCCCCCCCCWWSYATWDLLLRLLCSWMHFWGPQWWSIWSIPSCPQNIKQIKGSSLWPSLFRCMSLSGG